jgi:hypothetical protein
MQKVLYICVLKFNSMTIEARKYNLISRLTQVQDDNLVLELEKAFVQVLGKKNAKLQKLIQPMRRRINIVELAKEQHFFPKGSQFVDNLAKEMDISESIEELINMI